MPDDCVHSVYNIAVIYSICGVWACLLTRPGGDTYTDLETESFGLHTCSGLQGEQGKWPLGVTYDCGECQDVLSIGHIPEDFIPCPQTCSFPCGQHVYVVVICWLNTELFGGKGCIVGDTAPSLALV